MKKMINVLMSAAMLTGLAAAPFTANAAVIPSHNVYMDAEKENLLSIRKELQAYIDENNIPAAAYLGNEFTEADMFIGIRYDSAIKDAEAIIKAYAEEKAFDLSKIRFFPVEKAEIMKNVSNSELCYIGSVLEKYLVQHITGGIDISSDNIYISEPFNVYDVDEGKMSQSRNYIILRGKLMDEVLGVLAVDEIGGKYYSSFEYLNGNEKCLTKINDEGKEFAFLSYNEQLCVLYDSKVVSTNNEQEIDISILDIETKKLTAYKNVQEFDVNKEGDYFQTDRYSAVKARVNIDENDEVSYYLDDNGDDVYDVPAEKGDVNLDGRINAVDASIILSAYAEAQTALAPPKDEAKIKCLGDTNNDGHVNALDATEILAVYAENSVNREK